MTDEVVSIHAAKAKLSQLVARAERGERITIARNGKPVAELGPTRRKEPGALLPEDPLLNLKSFAVDGKGGDLTNTGIDRTLYGSR